MHCITCSLELILVQSGAYVKHVPYGAFTQAAGSGQSIQRVGQVMFSGHSPTPGVGKVGGALKLLFPPPPSLELFPPSLELPPPPSLELFPPPSELLLLPSQFQVVRLQLILCALSVQLGRPLPSFGQHVQGRSLHLNVGGVLAASSWQTFWHCSFVSALSA
jgi:hypothetical protein